MNYFDWIKLSPIDRKHFSLLVTKQFEINYAVDWETKLPEQLRTNYYQVRPEILNRPSQDKLQMEASE